MNTCNRAGIYIHVPFCEKKCGYCDFYSIVDFDFIDAYVESLKHEITIRAEQLSAGIVFDTVYIGGGTPSLLTTEQILEIFNVLNLHFKIQRGSEITIELNPESVTIEKLNAYHEAGINRLSIGFQSLIDRELQFLGRIHSATQATNVFNMARAGGFDNISLDLIYALPGQNPETWKRSLAKAVELSPEHISTYSLIFEEGTPFHRMLLNNEIQAKNDAQELELFNMTIDYLETHGYDQYEISSYARDKMYESRHNSKYWQHLPYLGLGPSAHSFWEGKRWSNYRSVAEYQSALKSGELPVGFMEHLEAETLKFEYIFLRLRTTAGIDLRLFEKRYAGSFLECYADFVDQLINSGYAEIVHNHFRLTRKGLSLSDEILPNFIPS